MKSLVVSKRAQNVIASPIRKFLPLVRQAEAKGLKVFKLNTGDPDLEMPELFLKTVRSYGSKTLGYAPSSGLPEHVSAWQNYYRQFKVNLRSEQIIPTMGCAEAIMLALQAVADPGDEVIVFEPVYVSYKSFSVMTGIKLVPVMLPFNKNFSMPSIKTIEEKISSKTRAIVIVNPDNPTGKLWSNTELNFLIGLAKKHKLFIISDETYREIRFRGVASCLLARKGAEQNIILVDSVSKRFSMPGARIGCVASFNPEIMQAILKFAQARLSAGTLEQLGLAPLLNNSKPYTDKIKRAYELRQKIVIEGLSKIKGAIFKPAHGAFYQAVQLPVKDAEDFVRFLVADFSHNGQTVMVTPMKDFYITPGYGLNEIRIANVLNLRDLKTAIDILRRGVEKYLSRSK